MHFFPFYMEAEAQIGAGICGASAVFFQDQFIPSVLQGTPEIVQIKIPGIGFRILADKQLHGSGSVLKIKVGADQVCMRRQIRIKFVIEKGMMVKVMLIYGNPDAYLYIPASGGNRCCCLPDKGFPGQGSAFL